MRQTKKKASGVKKKSKGCRWTGRKSLQQAAASLEERMFPQTAGTEFS